MATVCVACATESTGMICLYMHPLKLDVMFSEITGINEISSDDNLCILCYDVLKEAHQFRKKCQHRFLLRQKPAPTAPLTTSLSVEQLVVVEETPSLPKVVDEPQSPQLQVVEPQSDEEPPKVEDLTEPANEEEPELEYLVAEYEMSQVYTDEKAATSEADETVTVVAAQSPVARIGTYRKKRCKNPATDIFEGVDDSTCECCFETFDSPAQVRAHSKCHLGEAKPYRCKQPDCQSQFKDRAGVRSHYKVHVEGKKFACAHCPQVFTQKGNLAVHQRIHEGIKPFPCGICGKHFSESGNLRTHLRFHNDERPYKCNYCEKSFRTHYSHKIHERLHTNERPFSCEICGKSFYSSGKLQNHVRIHTGERKYVCTEPGCKAAFIESNGLRRHRRVHSKNKDEV